ncbi:geranylgeranyl pyrophosphate synthase [Corynebacterium sp. HMSC08A12]|uniref:polyprenyl synthetase family protein n=1 Tax=Corynebacterium sp. HMSC08A12 TaxID=1581134 RepID=UPI0008A2BC7A|nr:polyprenyl synthetase family protein [Corynebacterium sp. HMSC08A12]OFT34530.1 geranylgeranyl pyrophosphate synthase [Corynebacterium sp. HMSC08A12]
MPSATPRKPALPDVGDAQLNEALGQSMQQVEQLLKDRLSVGESFLTDKISHLFEAGGKRFRVMFALLAAHYGEKPTAQEVNEAAAVVELTHLATLYHDDVMDESDQRRGAESANKRWNNSVAILAGDYLFAIASEIMATLGAQTVQHFAETFQELVTGQMRETIGARDGEDEIEHYLTVIQEKTGVLIASAGWLGALHSGASEEHREALFRFGRNVGQIFQIVDDIIDIWADPEVSGKQPGTDLREGVFTLPVLYAMQQDDATGARLREILTGPVTDDALVDEALELIRGSEGREKSFEVVRRYRHYGEDELAKLPENQVTQALRHLMDFALERLG